MGFTYLSVQNSEAIQILSALLSRAEGLWEWQRLWEGHRPHCDGGDGTKNNFIWNIPDLCHGPTGLPFPSVQGSVVGK